MTTLIRHNLKAYMKILSRFFLGTDLLSDIVVSYYLQMKENTVDRKEVLTKPKQDFNAKRRNAFSFSSSVEFSCPQRSRSVESRLVSRTICSGRRFSFDWSVLGLESRQTLFGRLEHRPRTGFREFLL